MKAVLHVSLDINGEEVPAAIDISGHELLRFEGIRTTDVPEMERLADEMPHMGRQHLMLKMKRQDAANAIALELAHFIIRELQKRDTLNGYPLKIEDDVR